jgi:hypothetical protein
MQSLELNVDSAQCFMLNIFLILTRQTPNDEIMRKKRFGLIVSLIGLVMRIDLEYRILLIRWQKSFLR